MQTHLRRFFLIFILIGLVKINHAQEIPIGSWRDHLSYSNGVSVDAGNGKIYCASESAAFVYDLDDFSTDRLNMISGLSDIGIETIKFNPYNNKLIIAYSNGNIDIINEDREITNLPFIKTSNIIADKVINHIIFSGKYAYLSTGFGVVLLDTDQEEIIDTYYFGPLGAYMNTNAVAIDNQNIYAATAQGVYFANKASNNLADYNEWSLMSDLGLQNYSNITTYAGTLIVGAENSSWETDTVYYNNSGTWQKLIDTGVNLLNISVSSGKLLVLSDGTMRVFNMSLGQDFSYYTFNNQFSLTPNSAIIQNNGEVWMADKNYGLLHFFSQWDGELISPNGPNTSSVFHMDISQNNLWITSGGYGQYRNKFLYNYWAEGEWKIVPSNLKNPLKGSSIIDLVSAAINPKNVNQVYLGSWNSGLLEFNDGELTTVYTAQDSPLDSTDGGVTSIGALDFDKNGNLWIASSYGTNVLSSKLANGNWVSFSFEGITSGNSEYQQLVAGKNNLIYLADRKNKKIFVLNTNGTIEDQTDDILFSTIGSTAFEIFSMAEDLDGEFWVGTSEGVKIIGIPQEAGSDFIVNPIYVQQDGQTQILLESESVTCISVDGANRKWIGTQNSGVYLMSEDGTEEVSHFTIDNSPLFSNNIYDIKIEGETGEVFIATEKGLISYKGTATESNDDFDNVFVYPNPVKPDYYGVIAIRGLTKDTDVRITDISGNLVYQTTSFGGQAIWDGNDLFGDRVQTGVYIVFNATKDGELKKAAKILFIN
jgi:ligand-binding sensor domain-containing protein